MLTAPEYHPESSERQGSALGLVQPETSDTGTREGSEFLAFSFDMRLRNMRRGVIEGSRLIEQQLAETGHRHYAAMVTLTYRDDVHWHKRQITEFIKRVRQHLKRRGIPFIYVWVLELTKRNRPHYHMLLWLPEGTMLPKPDRQGWWKHGSSRIERARSAVGYLVKYATKGMTGGDLPKHARLYGLGGLKREGREWLAWKRLPQYVREVWGPAERPARAKGGGFHNRATGEWMDSVWEVADATPGWEQITFRRKQA